MGLGVLGAPNPTLSFETAVVGTPLVCLTAAALQSPILPPVSRAGLRQGLYTAKTRLANDAISISV